MWSLFAAVGLFTIGAVLSIANGIRELIDPEPADNFVVGFIVLGVALVLESVSLTPVHPAGPPGRQPVPGEPARLRAQRLGHDPARRHPRGCRGDHRSASSRSRGSGLHADHRRPAVRRDRVHPHRAPARGDRAACSSTATASTSWARPHPRCCGRRCCGRLGAHPQIERVTYLHLEFTGPRRLYLVAAIDLTGHDAEEVVGAATAEDRDRPAAGSRSWTSWCSRCHCRRTETLTA